MIVSQQINGKWGLPESVCDMYMATDVICSTSSILNLVAISIDRYIAVTRPISYASRKNNKRGMITISFVWLISMAVGAPVVLGLNNSELRVPDLCIFYNPYFIICSSLTSFYIPCCIMLFLYYSIFKALNLRAKSKVSSKKPRPTERPGIVIENVAQTRRLAETTLGASSLLPQSGPGSSYIEEGPTNTGSGSQEDEEEGDRSPGSDDCHVISNDKSADFILATVLEENAMVVTLGSQVMRPSLGNNDSGYAASNIEEPTPQTPPTPNHSPTNTTHSEKPKTDENLSCSPNKHNSSCDGLDDTREETPLKRTSSEPPGIATEDEEFLASKKDSGRISLSTAKFNKYRVNRTSRKKREKSAARKERKATKTLAIVLGVFLICWVPFFTLNTLDAFCLTAQANCRPGMTSFILTTWLGYMNSFVNPVIYTIFNLEFRKAFKKIMHMGT